MEGVSTEELAESEASQLEGSLERGMAYRREEAEQQGSARCNQVPTCLAGAMVWGWGEAGTRWDRLDTNVPSDTQTFD